MKLSVLIDGAGPEEGGEFGTAAVVVKKNSHCVECGGVHDFERCPDCGADIILGFGLGAGPGFGPYKVCENFCGWFYKRALPHDEC